MRKWLVGAGGAGAIITGIGMWVLWKIPDLIWKVAEKVAVETAVDAARGRLPWAAADENKPAEHPAPPTTALVPAVPTDELITTGSLPAQIEHSSIAMRRATIKKKEEPLPADRFFRWLDGREAR